MTASKDLWMLKEGVSQMDTLKYDAAIFGHTLKLFIYFIVR